MKSIVLYRVVFILTYPLHKVALNIVQSRSKIGEFSDDDISLCVR